MFNEEKGTSSAPRHFWGVDALVFIAFFKNSNIYLFLWKLVTKFAELLIMSNLLTIAVC